MRLQALKPARDGVACPPIWVSGRPLPFAPTVLDRTFKAPAPNRKWIADSTYVWTGAPGDRQKADGGSPSQ